MNWIEGIEERGKRKEMEYAIEGRKKVVRRRRVDGPGSAESNNNFLHRGAAGARPLAPLLTSQRAQKLWVGFAIRPECFTACSPNRPTPSLPPDCHRQLSRSDDSVPCRRLYVLFIRPALAPNTNLERRALPTCDAIIIIVASS